MGWGNSGYSPSAKQPQNGDTDYSIYFSDMFNYNRMD